MSDATADLIEAADDAAGLLKVMVVTHAAHMSADQRQLIKETADKLAAAAVAAAVE